MLFASNQFDHLLKGIDDKHNEIDSEDFEQEYEIIELTLHKDKYSLSEEF